MALVAFKSLLYDFEKDILYESPSYVVSNFEEKLATIVLRKEDFYYGTQFYLEEFSDRVYGSFTDMGNILEANPLLHPMELQPNSYFSLRPISEGISDSANNNNLLIGNRNL